MAEVVVTSERDKGSHVQRIESGKHELVADEPPPAGDDRGPGPYELLLSALGSCTSMTLHMYADHKEWKLDRVTVRLRYDRLHVEDCEEGEAVTRRVHKITREIGLEGELTDEQRAKLVEVAEKCPVHRTLAEEKEFVTTLAS